MSELRYWQRTARFSSGIGALVWLGLGFDRWGDGRYVIAAVFLVLHVLWGYDALRAHLALRKADQ